MVESRVVQIAGIETEFVKCPSGSFEMGSVHGLPLEQPIRDVTIEAPFWISTRHKKTNRGTRTMNTNRADVFAGELGTWTCFDCVQRIEASIIVI